MFDRTESRAEYFFKDILPAEAFTRRPPEEKRDDEEVDKLIDEALRWCEEISEPDASIDNPSKFAENFDDRQPNVPLTTKVMNKIPNGLNPQKRGI